MVQTHLKKESREGKSDGAEEGRRDVRGGLYNDEALSKRGKRGVGSATREKKAELQRNFAAGGAGKGKRGTLGERSTPRYNS